MVHYLPLGPEGTPEGDEIPWDRPADEFLAEIWIPLSDPFRKAPRFKKTGRLADAVLHDMALTNMTAGLVRSGWKP